MVTAASERAMAWRKANPERAREIQRKSDKKYPARIAATRARHRVANLEAYREQQRRFHAKHPEYRREKVARYKARALDQECGCCDTEKLRKYYLRTVKARKEVDHKRPIRCGGMHCIKNLQMLTSLQHREKSKLDYKLWWALHGAAYLQRNREQ